MGSTHGTGVRGFTLFEVVLWVAIAALAATVGHGILAPYARERRLQAAAERLVAAVEYARDRARHDGEDIGVQIAPAGSHGDANRVQLTDEEGGVLHHPLDDSKYVLDFDGDPTLQGIDVVSASAGGDAVVTFDAQGVPDAGANIVLGSGASRTTVRVEAYTGRVSIAEGALFAEIPDALPLR